MTYVKWTFIAIIVLIVGGFLHYTLPQHDVVRLIDARERQIEWGENDLFFADSSSAENREKSSGRYVNFISGARPNDDIEVYRNQDTGWGWPPYFKFDTSNLQAKASDMISSKEDPDWVIVTHYGWRNEYLSIYPNAVEIRPVEGPDVTVIPWFNIAFLSVFAIFGLWVWRVVARFREDRIEPMIDDMEDTFEAAGDRAQGIWSRLFGSRG
ncbi:hypothetical protein RGUI_3721 [Rhodovulum sp. P5]|uniref:DUF1523 family protein n=1 Tax=Rhodovulum sp. P5 TaxID=1564506 RepID=UPI0009C39536|nr:DUF1523 family protein [Rhodovulum sp. P5]ARE41862.1 hypothetical protein RGUI_3721 [Rhodovulum sp. P5]